ncbi:MAG TPA: EAL domain-containing protein [Acidiphilium sp.]
MTQHPDMAGDTEARRNRAVLRRIAAGEQRKRATRIADALHDGSFCLRYLPRLRLAPAGTGSADTAPAGHLDGAELWIGLPNRKRGLIAVTSVLRDLNRQEPRADVLRFGLEAATAEVATWPETWRIAVPVTGRTLADGTVLDAALHALDAARVAPGRLDLQIDETELIESGAPFNPALGDLRSAGLGVTLDGFGATFGSLALLSRLPLSGLKLDRRFVRATAPDDGAPDSGAISDTAILARAAIETARLQGLTVTIDGIETETELRRMHCFGADCIQGPWIGAPMQAETLRARARAQS